MSKKTNIKDFFQTVCEIYYIKKSELKARAHFRRFKKLYFKLDKNLSKFEKKRMQGII